MSGKDIFDALGQIDEKTAADNVSRFNKKPPNTKRSETVSNIFNGVKIAAAVVLIVGFAVFMWYFAEKMKDPPIDPAQSGTQTAAYQTEPPTDTEPDLTEPHETEAQTEAPESLPETDYELAGYLIKKLAVADMDEDEAKAMQAQLFSLGDDALYYCADNYSSLSNDEKIVIGMFISEYVKDEVTGTDIGIMQGSSFIDFGMDRRYKMADWYASYVILAKSYGRKTEKNDFVKDLPVTYKILSRLGFKSYMPYTPENHTIGENIEQACLQKSLSPVSIYRYYKNYTQPGKDERAQLYEIYKNGDDLHRALVGYIVYNCFSYNNYIGNDHMGYVFRTGREYFEYIPAGEQQWRKAEFSDVAGSANESSTWLETVYSAIKEEAASLCLEEFAYFNPVLYGFMEEDGFDGYKPGEPDIAFRAHRALYAATELYWAVEYGYLRGGMDSIGLNEFYAYFEKYLDKDIVKAYIRNTEGLYIEGDVIYLKDLGPQTGLEIDLRSAHVISQNGGKAVIGVNIGFPNGMFVCDREMTFEVTEDKNGIRVTGGSFVEKVLIPYQNAALTLNYVMETYMVLRQADPRYRDFLTFGKTYESFEKVPEAYRDLVGENDEFPLFLITDDPSENYWLKKSVSAEILEQLCKTTPAFDGSHLHPENVNIKLEPAFEHIYEVEGHEFCLPWFDILRNMKVVKASGGNITAALDFIREQNGKKQNVTYTFELKYIAEDDGDFKADSYVLTGGTFVTELIYGK